MPAFLGPARCPILVGRVAEMALVDQMLAAGAARGGTLVITGEPGVGKTRLADELKTAALFRQMLVLAGRATPESQGVAWRPLIEALAVASRTIGLPVDPTLTAYRAVLGLLVPDWRDAAWRAPIEPPVVVGEAVIRLLALMAPVALVIEDVHWADDHTIGVL